MSSFSSLRNGAWQMISVMRTLWELLFVVLTNFCSISMGMNMDQRSNLSLELGTTYCLSWRLAVEVNNLRSWRTVPPQCVFYVENYMLGGQYARDVDMAVEQMISYMNSIVQADDGKDAFILDVDDTCISNLPYYEGKRFGGDPFDPAAFKNWAQRGICPAIPAVLMLYMRLIEGGFKVFLLTGRDEEVLGYATAENLYTQGFVGHERLIMRAPEYRGQSAVLFKSAMRKQLIEEGYRIRGNIGDQWSDLLGDCVGDHTFKVPNPMYYIP